MRNAGTFALLAAAAMLAAAPFVVQAQAQAPSAPTPATQQRFADGNERELGGHEVRIEQD